MVFTIEEDGFIVDETKKVAGYLDRDNNLKVLEDFYEEVSEFFKDFKLEVEVISYKELEKVKKGYR